MRESELLKDIQVLATKLGHRLFRNNTALAWAGKVVRVPRISMISVGPSDVVIRNARPIHAGLCVGSSDMIGWTSMLVTPNHVGQRLAVFTAVEGKDKTRVTPEQKQFLDAVNKSGGIGIVARDVEDVMAVMG